MFLLKRFLISSHYFFLFSILFQSYYGNVQALEAQFGNKGKQKNAHKIELKNIILHKGKTIYSEYFEKTDGLMGFQADKRQNSPIKYTPHIGFKNYDQPPQGRNLGEIKVGELLMEYDSAFMHYMPVLDKVSTQAEIKNMFGRDVKFVLPADQFRKVQIDDRVRTLYIPKALDTISIEPSVRDSSYLLKVTNPFKVKWNADKNNKNGVAVLLDWSGEINLPNNGRARQKKWHTIIDIFEDNGEAIIDERYLKELPEGALFMVWLIRGNIDIEEYQKGKTLKGASEIRSQYMFVSID
ncbi:hypothetical protein R9C00_29130 [Flammeovirgaceae bacterium SG7u.111]|nr:hypothetical protein [Flammeovirgaceae bacterium SG7u.132]WPO35763.1 hypothetical protein R9C00_29130 [Flammeovirgaceae bacterium SG7u.111]